MSQLSYMEKLLDGFAVEWKSIGEVFDLKNGYTPSKANTSYWTNGEVPWFRMEDIRTNGRVLKSAIQSVSTLAVKGKLIPANSLIMSTTATLGEHALIEVPFLTNQQITSFSISDAYSGKINIKFMFHYFFKFGEWCSANANKNGGMGIISIAKLKQFKIPIPCPDNPEKSLAIQSEIVRILDKFTALTAELTAELNMRKKQYNYYRDQLLSFDEGEGVTPMSIGDIYDFQYGKGNTIPKEGGQYPVYGSNGVVGTHHEYNSEDSPVIGHIGAYAGIVNWGKGKHFVTYNGVICKHKSKEVNPQFAYYILLAQDFGSKAKNSSQPFVSYDTLKEPVVLIPSLAEQERIVSILDKFDALTSSITEGLPREIELRQKQYEYYRDLLLSFPKSDEAA
ncbi:restriction endonuclease subunit S [Proteus terrae]|uniref:restriction endonuclease subunit S n=1 Tax=Proteus terrae TaxID=1574161 RepID=UPI001BA6D7CE|nr:restriction endonuclease subunit S [Proteus terrae]QUT00629.1 restriction endonuclease subunit S [Proteus terrae subsp. cibarius]